MITDIVYEIILQIQLGINNIRQYTTPLVYFLLGLDIAIFLIMMALGKHQNLGTVILKIFTIGVMFYLFNNYEKIAYYFQRSIMQIALKVSPNVDPNILISPSDMLSYMKDHIFDELDKLIKNNTSWLTGLKLQIFYAIALVCVTVCIGIIAIQISVALVFFHLVVLMGLILMPFNFFEHTKFIGAKVFPAIAGAAIKIGMITILAGIIINVFDKLLVFPEDISIAFLLSLITTSGFSAYLCIQSPQIANGLLSGMPALSFSGIMQNLTGLGRGAQVIANRAQIMASGVKNTVLAAHEGIKRAKYSQGNSGKKHLNKNFR